MIKIAFIDLVFRWPPTGGSSVDIKNIAAGLQKRGFDVKLFVPLFQEYYPRGVINEELFFPVTKIPFNRFSFNFSTATKRISKAVEDYKPDYIFFGDGYYLKPYIVSRLAKNFPVIWRFYAYEILCIMYRFFKENELCKNNLLLDQKECLQCQFPDLEMYKEIFKIILNYKLDDSDFHHKHEFLFSLAFKSSYAEIVKQALKDSKAIVVYNDFIKGIINRYNDDIRIIPSGVDTKAFHPNPAGNSGKSGKTTIFAPGRMVDLVKGFPFLETTVKLLSLKRDDFKVLLTSNESFIKFHGLRLRTDDFLLFDWKDQASLPEIYSRSDICVVPSVWQEPLGIMAIEAMSSGIPVIATRVGGLQNSVENGITGFLVDPGNIMELMDRLEILMDNVELRKKMGEAGRERALQKYDWDLIIENNYLPLFV